MKRPLIAGSLLANVLLATLVWRPSLAPESLRGFLPARSVPQPTRLHPDADRPSSARPLATVTSPWGKLYSEDFKTLRDRLLAAGFPPLVIREIIIAEINARCEPRINALNEADPQVPFWKLPALNYYSATDKRHEEHYEAQRERSRLVRDLLSDPMFSTIGVTADQRRRFGNLPRAKMDALQRIEDDYREMLQAVQFATKGVQLPEDNEKLALLQREKKADLASVLTPGELADYEVRTSPITTHIRTRLGEFDASEAEFKTLYAAFGEMGNKYGTSSLNVDPQKRQEIERDFQNKLRTEFGEARYSAYLRETNEEFQLLSSLARRENVARDSAVQAFQARDAAIKESNRIFDDPTLPVDQKRAALQTLAQETRTKITAALGNAAPAYLRTANTWLQPLERGSAVDFSNNSVLFLSTGQGGMVFLTNRSPRIRNLPKG